MILVHHIMNNNINVFVRSTQTHPESERARIFAYKIRLFFPHAFETKRLEKESSHHQNVQII